MFGNTYHWFIIDKASDKDIENLLSTLELSLDTTITLAQKPSDEENDFSLYDIYNPGFGFGGQMQKKYLGKWNHRLKFDWNKFAGLNKLGRRLNLTGVVLKAKVVVCYIFHYIFILNLMAILNN